MSLSSGSQSSSARCRDIHRIETSLSVIFPLPEYFHSGGHSRYLSEMQAFLPISAMPTRTQAFSSAARYLQIVSARLIIRAKNPPMTESFSVKDGYNFISSRGATLIHGLPMRSARYEHISGN